LIALKKPDLTREDAVKLRILIASVLSLATAGFILAAPSDPAGMIVHEWGTFLAMSGSDGISLDGMYHEEHALPSFVHARSRDQLHLPMSNVKGETPVIYFYSQQPSRVQVEVGFPTGLWTQWYPQATLVSPGIVQAGSPPQTRNGRIKWDVTVCPASRCEPRLPAAAADALWNFARDVDAAYVTPYQLSARGGRPENVEVSPMSDREWERFIFYRGLGEAPLPMQVRLADGRIMATTSEAAGARHVFVLRVENGRGAYAYVPALTATETFDRPVPSMEASQPIDAFVTQVSDDVARRLVESGLYEKEARAMVNTWASSYFKTDGVRLLFVMPQSWTDRFIPMRITPAPQQLVRVMVGRVELLDRVRESRAEQAIGALASSDTQVRERAFELLRSEGRYVEPIVRRTLKTTADEHVRTLSKRLLLTDFVTELRTALTDATTGERVSTNPVHIQAQLASLLREVGLTVEATQEGEAALVKLSQMRQPTMSDHRSREMFRSVARAHEGAGHDAEALAWYGKFVEFGSQVAKSGNEGCAQMCHSTLGPTDKTFFYDWYAGRKFGELAVKTGEAARLIAAHEAEPHPIARHNLQLAYLYEATGKSKKAQEVWARLGR
jgi:hypothetical protein